MSELRSRGSGERRDYIFRHLERRCQDDSSTLSLSLIPCSPGFFFLSNTETEKYAGFQLKTEATFFE